jgi:hypothetical protein
MHLDGISFVDALEALRPSAKVSRSISRILLARDLVETVEVALPMQDSAALAVSVKDNGYFSRSVEGFSSAGVSQSEPCVQSDC